MVKLGNNELGGEIGMSDYITVTELEVLTLPIDNNHDSYGASQLWYPNRWQRGAGCGPTAASNSIWYLAKIYHPYAKDLISGYKGIQDLMEAVWNCMTPSLMGVKSIGAFTKGAFHFAGERGFKLQSTSIEISAKRNSRPSIEFVVAFIHDALYYNRPVSFLNLSNGALSNLESWHWVTIVGFSVETMDAIIYDNGRKKIINIKTWLETTLLGGGMVALDIE